MKALPLKADGNGHEICTSAEATHLMLSMPGPFPTRIIPVIRQGPRDGTGCWSWNGDVMKPTLRPSILTEGVRELTDEEIARVKSGEIIDLPKTVCHTWITDGQVIFLSDCTHEFAGQTLDLLDQGDEPILP